MPYTADKPIQPPTPEELRARIPGWGVDLDHADRPAFPKERFDPGVSGAHWRYPDEQQPRTGREQSIEHEQLPPVFGTAQPLHGVSGAVRRFAYERFSEGRTGHWLLLILGDRLDTAGARVSALASGRPDHLIGETGVLAEAGQRPLRSRLGRPDARHQLLDPLIVLGPSVLLTVGAIALGRRILRR